MSIRCKHWSFCENTLIISRSEPSPGSGLVVSPALLDPPQATDWLWRPKRRLPALCPQKACLQASLGQECLLLCTNQGLKAWPHLPGYTSHKSRARGRLGTGRDFNYASFSFREAPGLWQGLMAGCCLDQTCSAPSLNAGHPIGSMVQGSAHNLALMPPTLTV